MIKVEHDVDIKIKKKVSDPKLSLKRFLQYTVATENGKKRILSDCKYPNDYVPRFYELARKFACDVISANYESHDLYFDEFKRQASAYRNEAKDFPVNKDAHKNRMFSADALEEIVAMSKLLEPILNNYIFNSNLTHRKDAITKNGVKIGSMADMLLFKDAGLSQVGFLKFNFTKKKISEQEAQTMLFVLQTFFQRQGIALDLKSSFLIDVFAWRVYTPNNAQDMGNNVDKATLEIRNIWDLI